MCFVARTDRALLKGFFMSLGGYCLAYRAAWSNPVFRDLLDAAIWNWIYQSCAWEDTTVRVNGCIFNIKRGDLVTTVSFISKGFRISEQSTKTLLKNLEKSGMINKRTNKRATIISVCNYSIYQDLKTTTNQRTNKRVTNAQQTPNYNNNTLNTLNEINEVRESVARDRAPKGRAFRNWLDVLKSEDPAVSPNACPDCLYDEAKKLGFEHTAIAQWEKFHDYWIAKTGQSAVKSDWIATWRNWLRRSFDG